MKTFLFYAVLICTIVVPAHTVAQTSLSSSQYTYFKPYNQSTSQENVSLNFPNGDTFEGYRFDNIVNGTITFQSYYGTYRKANGDKFITQQGGDGFKVINNNFGFYNGAVWYLTTDNRLYCMIFNNGTMQSQTEEYRPHYFDGNYLVFTTDYGTGAGGYSSGSGSTHNSDINSSYDDHKTTCSGCNGTKACMHCDGTGYVNNFKSKCGWCHGTGKCGVCHGMGFIRY